MHAGVRFLNYLDPTASGYALRWRSPNILRVRAMLESQCVDIDFGMSTVIRRVIPPSPTLRNPSDTTTKISPSDSDEYLKRLAQECRAFLETP
jgi:hypothetical protein